MYKQGELKITKPLCSYIYIYIYIYISDTELYVSFIELFRSNEDIV